MGRIFLVRHGTIARDPHMLVGQLDLPLSSTGAAVMAGVASTWQKYLGEEIDGVVSSDLSRCVESAKILLQGHPDIPFHVDPGFREISLGRWEGLNKAAIEKKWPGWLAMRWMDMLSFVPPDGESYRGFQRRILSSLRRLRREYPRETLALVTHAGVIRVLLAACKGVPLRDVLQVTLEYGDWIEVPL